MINLKQYLQHRNDEFELPDDVSVSDIQDYIEYVIKNTKH